MDNNIFLNVPPLLKPMLRPWWEGAIGREGEGERVKKKNTVTLQNLNRKSYVMVNHLRYYLLFTTLCGWSRDDTSGADRDGRLASRS